MSAESTGLRTQLDAAIRARLDLARAVIAFGEYQASIHSTHPKALCMALTAHVIANDPTTVTRMCERDLAVLERHGKAYGDTSDATWERMAFCDWCGQGLLWPCPEIKDLAVAYGLLDPTSREADR